MRITRNLGWAPAIAGALALALSPPAHGATTIGETPVPDTPCGVGSTWLQALAPANGYAAPTPGVITSWSFRATAIVPQIKFKVARPLGGANYSMIGESELTTPDPGTLSTYPARIAVQAGDLLGLFVASVGECARSDPDYANRAFASDHAPGTVRTYGPLNGVGGQLGVAASLEPDADADGFGDETQDACPSDATRQGECALPDTPDTTAPDTSITKGPPAKVKTKKRKRRARVSFEFAASEPGSSFSCRIDAAAFAACTSPVTAKLKRGRHTFEVVATDVAGNADATAATTSFRVKRRRHAR